jgi:EAL domain-containing protein (putative c-di-GMP-specific phosphodiesterase class I)
VRLVVDLAHALGMRAVAEGVETAEAMDLLRKLGCDQAQGYFISRPIEARDVQDFLRKYREGDQARRA